MNPGSDESSLTNIYNKQIESVADRLIFRSSNPICIFDSNIVVEDEHVWNSIFKNEINSHLIVQFISIHFRDLIMKIYDQLEKSGFDISDSSKYKSYTTIGNTTILESMGFRNAILHELDIQKDFLNNFSVKGKGFIMTVLKELYFPQSDILTIAMEALSAE